MKSIKQYFESLDKSSQLVPTHSDDADAVEIVENDGEFNDTKKETVRGKIDAFGALLMLSRGDTRQKMPRKSL